MEVESGALCAREDCAFRRNYPSEILYLHPNQTHSKGHFQHHHDDGYKKFHFDDLPRMKQALFRTPLSGAPQARLPQLKDCAHLPDVFQKQGYDKIDFALVYDGGPTEGCFS